MKDPLFHFGVKWLWSHLQLWQNFTSLLSGQTQAAVETGHERSIILFRGLIVKVTLTALAERFFLIVRTNTAGRDGI